MKKIITLLAALALPAAGNALAAGQITVHAATGDSSMQIDDVQRLSQLLTHPGLNTWWPGTVIAERGATAAVQQQRHQLLTDLRAWQGSSDAALGATIGAVIRQLNALPVTGRQFTSLDIDWLRLHPEADRALQGSYDLYTLPEPHQVLIMGALARPGAESWQPGRSVRDYLAAHERLTGGDRSVATVIAPSGEVRQVPVAYWNQRHAEVEPGSIIWLGFTSWSLPWGQADLNTRLISVLTHRIPQ
ncbi:MULTISPECIES: capsule biosynthesis GfcC family protein [Pantoea]|uniref:Capsule biosynthesis GfcC family protein n=1 Tax=Pantoea eucrina TaxID=472693 RepID=A0ABS1Z4X8_9GAMM|nr:MULTISPECIES: capsule biosynthesis GfcC family protein [Pantoea]AIX49956.1 hypothetical protein PSNIH1_06795 [Pantoea sp. PSNIH1]KAA6045637.1 hypothetical protein F3I35_13080 [Pantoea sp. Bo_7]KAA6090986.1 hypothetical protein F3I22_13085 [Pantoea sp. Bo_10]MBM0747462.1 capsule biosynthesis GfcC family protein [Pantoea eucrina]MDJ0021918.1 capsule biosynthesis GfcC family protein [Pantoea eucrina]